MSRVYGSPFKVDWSDRNAVIAYAKRLGSGMTVYKHPARNNYNITHTQYPDRYAGMQVEFQS
jgi:hypothetical protein